MSAEDSPRPIAGGRGKYGISLNEKELRTLLAEGHVEHKTRDGALYPTHWWVTLNGAAEVYAKTLRHDVVG